MDNDTNVEIFNRKKAWAELEREQDQIKSNIKTLMRKGPDPEMDSALLAQRIASRDQTQTSKAPETKSKSERKTSGNDRSKSRENDGRRAAEPAAAGRDRSKEKLNKDRSNEDLSLSSQSKAQ